MLKKATNKMAYAKVGIYGTAGSGKTRTATEIAIGLHKAIGSKKPIAVFDTEPAFSFVLPVFEKNGIEVLIEDSSRALIDLMRFMDEAEKVSDIVIIDSITHVWRDAQESYLARINKSRASSGKKPIGSLEFHHWRPIKAAWAEFTDRFLSSKMHVIVCGRAGSIYEYQDKDDGSGKKELITTGTRMATEKELGYEPSLLVEMIIDREDGKMFNVAVIQKDRSDTINGAELRMPTYKSFEGHFKALNIGGQHFESMEKRDSQEMFVDADESGWDKEKREREILAEEIKSDFITFGLDGNSAEAKTKRNEAMTKVFGTGSWTQIESMHSRDLREKREKLKVYLNDNAGG